MSACESAENAGKCAEAKRRVDSAKPNPKGAQASARLAAELAAHPFSPRTRHLAVTSLRSCARLRLRGYPPLRFGAFTFGCTFALRCIIRSPIRAVRLRMEYHPSPSITVSPAPYASRRPCALRSPVALRLSPSRYWSRIPFPSCGASAPYSRAKRGMEQYMSFRQSLRPKTIVPYAHCL